MVLALPLLLAACDLKLPDKVADARAKSDARAMAEAEGKIECLVPGANAFAYACSIDRTQTQDGLYLSIRHPDGGFHRLLVTRDGRGVIAADGAEQAQVAPISDTLIEVSIAGAHYRLPATVRQPAGSKAK